MSHFFSTFSKLISLSLITGILLLCHASFSLASTSHENMSMPMPMDGQQSQMMPCCDVQIPLNGMMHDFIVMPYSQHNLINLIVLALVFVFSYTRSSTLNIIDHIGQLYDHHLRRRYGSEKLFNYLIRFFRIGLLHPKIW